MSESAITVLETGPLVTVQDAGRAGRAALGIGRSGACDRGSYRLGNRLVGNAEGAAGLEVTFGGLAVRAHTDLVIATTGARCAGDFPHNAPTRLAAGETLRLGAPTAGLRTYVAIRGGVAVDPVLGSRSTDLLAGLGPPELAPGLRLPIGTAYEAFPDVDVAPIGDPSGDDLVLPVLPGPRWEWFGEPGWSELIGARWTVSSSSNRVGIRLEGDPLTRARSGELPSEGMVRGALQVPASGLPVLFLADHPVTGGYPVIGYIADDAVDACGQLAPGQVLRLCGSASG